ncbi:3-oxoacyl-[acyl-carrier protein] reductase [Halalkalibacter wakoensis JCM 9140]|uniref:3-oxoacyl-[acyl-carrier protein] reductase n=1 Tax=Halalkalibacter wakoensis JCM 9140 TaxID=1236970 RepID=W4Q9R3_9BACI|nr:3-oxoacyl-ACP reductase [Halalkalibacter wakoensis]GAE28129.1 3-oxoacyl-[acyl-carrier protein] reductase [Halalkalibacter wakoensis JCM 9140]
MKLSDQVVLITGGSRGLGAAIAKAFGREGAKVVVNYYQNEAKAQEVVDEIGKENAIAIQGDVRELLDVEVVFQRAKEHFNQPITTVVNNALVQFSFDAANRKTVDSINWDDYQVQFEGSVKASLNTVKVSKNDMVDQKFGRIINIGTNLVQNPVVAYHEYNTSKAALLGFTRNMAKDLGPNGITVNMVSGGLLEKTDASAATPDDVFALIRQSTPLQKVTTPEDVADAVLFFASPWARGVTGQNLVVDGGLVMD